MRQNNNTTLSAVLTASPTWEAVYDCAKYKIKGHIDKYRTDPLPIQSSTPRWKEDRTDCKHLEAVPFKAHCLCTRYAFKRIVHECDCLKCRKYNPQTK